MRRQATTPLYHGISERVFQEQIRKLALYLGWLCYHTHDSRRSAAGFPDCVLVRGNRVIYAELKAAKGRVTPEQQAWLESLRRAEKEVYLWRPADIDEIERLLR